MDGSTLTEGTLLRVKRNAMMSPSIKYTPLPKTYNDGLKQPFQPVNEGEQVVFLGERHHVQVGDEAPGVPAMHNVIRVLTMCGPMWMSEEDLEEA